MKIEEAIKKAVDGGYKNSERWLGIDENIIYTSPQEKLFLDHLFWKSLGKSMGWKDEKYCPECGYDNFCVSAKPRKEWLRIWHRLIDHLAEGGTPESFFESLYKL